MSARASHGALAPALSAPAGWSLAALRRRFAAWTELRRQRRALARLTPAQLRDIGLDSEAAAAEAARAFWDAPRHWKV